MAEFFQAVFIILCCIVIASPFILGISVMKEREKQVNKQIEFSKTKREQIKNNSTHRETSKTIAYIPNDAYTREPVLNNPNDIYYEGYGCTWDIDKNGKRYWKILTEEQLKETLLYMPDYLEMVEKSYVRPVTVTTDRVMSIGEMEAFAHRIESRQNKINAGIPLDKREEYEINKILNS